MDCKRHILGALLNPKHHYRITSTYLLLIPVLFLSLLISKKNIVIQATSINYGISQQPITDVSMLVPVLCQYQSVICEGSFCIPGVKKCVCDLRQPVQVGRFCLRQVDLETKCFATSQCNHTIKDAVCVDTNSNLILDVESSKFKLEQWQHLNELRQASQLAVFSSSNQDVSSQQKSRINTYVTARPMYLVESVREDLSFEAKDDVIMSNARNSPYEINYYTPELLQQNHTRRKTNSSERSFNPLSIEFSTPANILNDGLRTNTAGDNYIRSPDSDTGGTGSSMIQSYIAGDTTTGLSIITTAASRTQMSTTESSPTSSSSNDLNLLASSTPPPTTSLSNELSKKKVVVKAPNWPPGLCSCPPGYMFDSMLRKCLALSLSDSHCMNDNDCRQIRSTHCEKSSKKCECDEPLIWNQTELACVRPRPKMAVVTGTEKPAQTLLLTELFPDQTIVLLLIFVVAIIIVTLVIMGLVVKCFSSNKPTLISPKNAKNKKFNQNSMPRSPYTTLRKADNKPNSTQLNSFTQATRGRILNYDFEQEDPMNGSPSPQPEIGPDMKEQHNTLDRVSSGVGGTLPKTKGHKHNLKSVGASSPETNAVAQQKKKSADANKYVDESLDLNELDSETKSESSLVMPPPQPTTNQPTYMLAGQQSAIAAAAAAVANRRNFGKPEFV